MFDLRSPLETFLRQVDATTVTEFFLLLLLACFTVALAFGVFGLWRRIFLDLPWEELLHTTLAEMLSGGLDHELMYRKRVRRALADYVGNVPPHVQAARKQGGASRWVRYIVTASGPEPVTDDAGLPRPDYTHYRERQLAPAADGILHFLGTSFAAVTDRQIAMF